MDSCNRFWFQPKGEQEQIAQIRRELNPAHSSRIIRAIDMNTVITLGQIVAAKKDGIVYRGKVMGIEQNSEGTSNVFQVRIFI